MRVRYLIETLQVRKQIRLHLKSMMKYSCLLKKTAISRLYSSACGKNELIYRNPYLKLKDHLEIPILDEGEIFSPDIQTIIAAQELFIPKQYHEIKKITSAIHSEKFPNHDLPEVLLFGRSNAGKSSLLKAIFQNVPDLLIKTSKKPGHTKTAQFFQVGSKLCIIDMPGTGENSPNWFRDVADGCLRRKNCVRAFLLVDGKLGFQKTDDDALSILDNYKVPYAIVMTKIDTAEDSRLLRNVLHLQNIKFSIYCYPQPFLVGMPFIILEKEHLDDFVENCKYEAYQQIRWNWPPTSETRKTHDLHDAGM